MANFKKFTDSAVQMLLKHANRTLKNDSNKDIVVSRSGLNYTIDMPAGEGTPRESYNSLKDSSYMYGRGTGREASAITCIGITVTLPKEISDYSKVDKTSLTILNPEVEKEFFYGVCSFVYKRLGTCFYNRTHYDEGGQPHISIYAVPRMVLDHDRVQYKTTNSHKAVRLPSGRYEYEAKYKLENGERIPQKNYDRMTDYFDFRISGKDFLNRAELQHFHKDLSDYLRSNNYPGADYVYTGKTGGYSLSVKSMKTFTKQTGLNIDDLRVSPMSREALHEILENTDLRPSDKLKIEDINKDALIDHDQRVINEKDNMISQLEARISAMEIQGSLQAGDIALRGSITEPVNGTEVPAKSLVKEQEKPRKSEETINIQKGMEHARKTLAKTRRKDKNIEEDITI